VLSVADVEGVSGEKKQSLRCREIAGGVGHASPGEFGRKSSPCGESVWL